MTFEKDIDSLKYWRGDMQADYLYPSGVAGDKLFKHIMKNDSFLASICQKCNKTYFPPRMYCEDCFSKIPLDEWIEVPACGIVKNHTVVTIDSYGEKLVKPRIIGMIKIDNTDAALANNSGDLPLKNVEVGAI